jgi:hypothetical protein
MTLDDLIKSDMDIRRKWESGCAGKAMYPSQQAAEFVKLWARHTLGRNFDPDHETHGAYECQFCGLWHLGHS